MQTDLDRALWGVVDAKFYKKQPRDAARCIAAGADINCQRSVAGFPTGEAPPRPETPLLVATARGMPRLVNRLLELGADPNLEFGERPGRTLLHTAAWHNRAEIAGMLIKAGVPLERKDSLNGWTALHLAVVNCHRHHLGARQLLADGADTHALDDTGRTPWQLLLEYEGQRFSPELKEILVKNGADQPGKTVTDGGVTDGTFAWKTGAGADWMKTLLKKERYHSNRRAEALASVVE
jgi:ankyrin repeat protein